MKRTHLLAVVAAIAIFTADASAYYHPTLGRWQSRDPGPQAAARLGTNGPAVSGGFMPRDQYADGMNLYRYAKGNPIVHTDPSGLIPTPKMGQQCQIGGKTLSLRFDGKNLHDTGGFGLKVEAVSGKPTEISHSTENRESGGWSWEVEITTYVFVYTTEWSKKASEGPIPRGTYWIKICEERNWRSSFWSHYVKNYAWGDYSWRLHEDDSTQTYGRSGFFLHGGSFWGSVGCMDVKGGDKQVHNLFERVRKQHGKDCCCYVKVDVGYKEGLKVVKEEQRWKFNDPSFPY